MNDRRKKMSISNIITIITLVTMITGFISNTYTYSKDRVSEQVIHIVDARICEEVLPILTEIKSGLDKINLNLENDKIYNIKKQVAKIKNDPVDVKISDVRKAVNEYQCLSVKPATLQLDYDFLCNWLEGVAISGKHSGNVDKARRTETKAL